MTPNVAAFLTMISHAEGTDRAPDPYRCCFGFKHTIVNLSQHPAISGEWMGESLAFLGANYAHSISTAAGRYQITRPTWSGLQTVLNLPDFTGTSQDDAAIQLIKEHKALDLIFAGRVEDAIAQCSGVWASLPGSKSGQPQRQLVDLIDAYGTAGGSFA
jgi:muramidase (phage lysozyme)